MFTSKSIFGRLVPAMLLLCASLTAFGQVNGEYRSAVTAGNWGTAASWETYNAGTASWAIAAAVPSGVNAIVTVRNGHTITLTGNVSFKKLTIDAGGSVISDASERRLDLAGDTSFLINNGNLGGIAASGVEKLNIANSPTCTIGTVTGTGTTSIARIRFNTSTATVTNNSTLIIDQSMTVTSSGMTAWYNNTGSTTNTTAENATITINTGKTVTMTGSGGLHSSSTSQTSPGGNYTYNINGTLDMTGMTGTSYIWPMTGTGSVVSINVSGVLKLAGINTAYTGTNPGSVALNILNGGLVEAVKSGATFNLGSKYWIVSGTGRLKRPVLIASGAVIFPVGTSATSYNPVTLTATTNDDSFAVNVRNTLSATIGDPTKIVTKQWELTPNGSGAGFSPVFGWVSADQAAAFSHTAPLRLFRYSSAPPAGWAPVATGSTITGSGTVAAPYLMGTVTPPATLSGQYVVGDSDAAVIVVPTVSITGSTPTTICANTPVTFTATTTNIAGAHYQWKVNGSNVGTDSIKFTTASLANGAVVTATISYTVGGTVAATSNAITMTVNPLPAAGVISGSASVCSGTTEALTSTVTGGVWSSSNPSLATVSSAGVVSGVAVGSVTIRYAVTNSCGTDTALKTMAVTLGANAGTLSGTNSVCPTGTTVFTSTSAGGNWMSNNTAIATVSSTGTVTGVSAGTANIAYVVTNGCGTDTARRAITVNPLPAAGTISGPAVVCTGSTITLSSSVSGGTWSSSNANATVAGGVVSGVTTGTSVITYTVTNTCGTAITRDTITVSTVPVVSSITGPSTVCQGATVKLSDSVKGGLWTNANSSVVTVNDSGLVTGIAKGSDVVTYTVTNACGAAAATRSITVTGVPDATTVSGPDSVCIHATVTLQPGNDNGRWASATGKTMISTDGIVTGLSAGIDTVYYGITNQCGTTSTPHLIVVWNCNALAIGRAPGYGQATAQIYPNPNGGRFSYLLSSPANESIQLVLTNITGAVLDSRIAKTNERIVYSVNYPSGLYFLTATSATGRTVTKIQIKE